jgi:hypothetical protein
MGESPGLVDEKGGWTSHLEDKGSWNERRKEVGRRITKWKSGPKGRVRGNGWVGESES